MRLKDLEPADQARVRKVGVPWRELEPLVTAGLSLDDALALAAARVSSRTTGTLPSDVKLVAMGVPVDCLVRWGAAGVYTFFPAVTGRSQVTPLTVEQVTRLFDMGGTADMMSYALTRGATADDVLELLEIVGDADRVRGVPLDLLGVGVVPADAAWLQANAGPAEHLLRIAPTGQYPTPESMPDDSIRRMVLMLASVNYASWSLPAAMALGRALELSGSGHVAEMVTVLAVHDFPAQVALEVFEQVKGAPASVLDTAVSLMRDGLDPHEAVRLALADESLEQSNAHRRRVTVHAQRPTRVLTV